jgi:TetR/AcrR family transcriptional regulator, transcriptional repressor for nem operon
MASTRKDEIVDVALQIIYRKGFSAFSYQDLSTAIGITKASIHGHFGTKEALGCHLIRRSHEELLGYLAEMEASGETSLTLVERMVDHHAELHSRDEACLATILQNEWKLLPDSMRELLAAHHATYLDWLVALFGRGRELGEMRFDESPRDRALFFTSALHGAILDLRSLQPAAFPTLRAQLLALVR